MERKIHHSTEITLEMRQEIESFFPEVINLAQSSFEKIHLYIRKEDKYNLEIKLLGSTEEMIATGDGDDFLSAINDLREKIFNKLLINTVLTAI